MSNSRTLGGSAAMSMTGDGLAVVLLALFGVMLVSAGHAKLANRWQFVAAIRTWRLFTLPQARALSLGLPIVELLVGALSLASLAVLSLRPLSLGCLFVLFAAFTVVQVAVSVHTKRASCGCGVMSTTMGAASIGRTAFFSAAILTALLAFLK